MTPLAEVKLWGSTIGAVSMPSNRQFGMFEYSPDFLRSGIELSPIHMPLSTEIYEFRNLPVETFHGLPGMLADSLPDKYGNALIDAWLATQGRNPQDFNAVERLCYTGSRGMGALEFVPATGPNPRPARRIQVDQMVELASRVLQQREGLQWSFSDGARDESLKDILRVGTSAGGARAKAIVAWNQQTEEVRSGQVDAGEGFSYWILKFDGVSGNKDKELEDPQGYGAVEYAYSNMAKAAGITMTDCRLMEEGGRRHFMTRRFDRLDEGKKLHMQSLGALAHFDYNSAGAHAYEEAFLIVRRLGLPMSAVEELFRRMAFNIVARNQDDHVKNIAFLMDTTGRWQLSPAYDLTYSYNPEGSWTSQHQMSMNGKRDHFELVDFRACGKTAMMKRGRAEAILDQVQSAVQRWTSFAEQAKIADSWSRPIMKNFRLGILR